MLPGRVVAELEDYGHEDGTTTVANGPVGRAAADGPSTPSQARPSLAAAQRRAQARGKFPPLVKTATPAGCSRCRCTRTMIMRWPTREMSWARPEMWVVLDAPAGGGNHPGCPAGTTPAAFRAALRRPARTFTCTGLASTNGGTMSASRPGRCTPSADGPLIAEIQQTQHHLPRLRLEPAGQRWPAAPAAR